MTGGGDRDRDRDRDGDADVTETDPETGADGADGQPVDYGRGRPDGDGDGDGDAGGSPRDGDRDEEAGTRPGDGGGSTDGDLGADAVTGELLAGAREGILHVREDGTVAHANGVAAELLGVDSTALDGAAIGTVVPGTVEDRLPAALSDEAASGPVEFEEYYPEREAWLSVRIVPLSGGRGSAVYLQEVTDRRERERTLSAREAEFTTVTRVNRLVGDLVASLVDRTDRERIETTVCERLAGSDLLSFAWLAEPTLDGDGLRERVTAGPGGRVVATLQSAGRSDVRAGADGRRLGTGADDDADADASPRPGRDTGTAARSEGGDADGPWDREVDGDGPDADVNVDLDLDRDRDVDPDGDPTAGGGIERAALAAGEVRVGRDLATDQRVPAPARRVAFERGLQSALAVPVGYGDTTYGVLAVYTDRPDAFAPRERTAFATLGEVLGLAINAAKQRRLLLSDTSVELELRFDREAAPLAALASRLGCRLVGAGAVPVDGGSVIQFFSVDGADPAAVLDRLRGADGPSLAAGRVVEGDGDSDGDGDGDGDEPSHDAGLLSLRLSGESPLVWLVDHGATIRSVVVDSGQLEVAATVAPAESRTLLDGLGDAFPGVELTGKRETDRDVRTAGAFRSTVRERLTDRQFEALRTGYLAGYFDWPRRSTAEEVADTMGISSATLHGHFRKSLRELLGVFFEAEGPDDRAD
jgi:predicted DNA binding protein/GAF domain-containing protein